MRLNTLQGLIAPVMIGMTLILVGCQDDSETTTATASTSLTASSSNAAHSTTAGVWEQMRTLFDTPTAHALSIGNDVGGNLVEITDFQVSIRDLNQIGAGTQVDIDGATYDGGSGLSGSGAIVTIED